MKAMRHIKHGWPGARARVLLRAVAGVPVLPVPAPGRYAADRSVGNAVTRSASAARGPVPPGSVCVLIG